MDPAATDGSCDNPSSPPARSTAGNQVSFAAPVVAAASGFLVKQLLIHGLPKHAGRGVVLPPHTRFSTLLPISSLNSGRPGLELESIGPSAGVQLVSSPTPTGCNFFAVIDLGFPPNREISNRHEHCRSSVRPGLFHGAEVSFHMAWYARAHPLVPTTELMVSTGPLESNASGSTMINPGLSSMGQVSGNSLTPPPHTRSLTSSPPRLSLTADQRELKRHQDKARRDTRLVTRMRRTSSNSYVDSPPPTMTLPSATTTMSLPAYTTAPAPVTLMSEPATTMGNSAYLQSYSSAIEDQQAQSAPVYPTSYPQSLQANYNMPVDYAAVYAGPGHYSTRPTSLPVGQDVGFMYQVPAVMASGTGGSHEGGHVRVVQSRPKPRCWEHGCNGRQFSTFSNLLRHQREKSGQAAKATCPNCGAEFTRTTARNGHLLHDKCKGRRNT
ncbi:hypothetical protein ACJZ2D_001843 [Fusarium nematophilum]